MMERTASGSPIVRHCIGGNRYQFDWNICGSDKGWQQYDTDQDASYFGAWVHVGDMKIVTFAEGDLSIVSCETKEQFDAEIAAMNKFYGPPPPSFTVINDDGITHHYDKDAAFGRLDGWVM